jgi:hypothetical protein
MTFQFGYISCVTFISTLNLGIWWDYRMRRNVR